MKISLIHGLGATCGVWADLGPILETAHRAEVDSITLAGHGPSDWTGRYALGALAAEASRHIDAGEPTVIVGHSLGGAVGLALASGWFGVDVIGVVGVGIKCRWTDEDVAGMARVAARGIRWFDTRDEAVDRALLQAGLSGLVDATHQAAVDSVVEGGSPVDRIQRGQAAEDEIGRWRVAQDPATFAQEKLDMAGLLAVAGCRVILGAGSEDAMVAEADLAELVPDPRIAEGRGHNVHVESPEWVASLVAELL